MTNFWLFSVRVLVPAGATGARARSLTAKHALPSSAMAFRGEWIDHKGAFAVL